MFARSASAAFGANVLKSSQVQGVASTAALATQLSDDATADNASVPAVNTPAPGADNLSGLQWDMVQIHAPEARAINGGSPSVLGGDIDTGLEPELAEAHLARGIAVSLSKRFDEAEREFETAMRLDPKLFEAPYFFGRTRRAQGRFADAVKLFERASALRPDDFQATAFLAQSYTAMGMMAEAEAATRRAARQIQQRLDLNPDDARACNLGAGIHATLGDSAKALEYAERSLAIDPEDPMLLYNVACTYSMLGKIDEGLSCLERAVDKGFGHKEWIDHDGDLDPLRDLQIL